MGGQPSIYAMEDLCFFGYPGVRLILAHSARGFNPQHNIDGLEALRTLDNVWFDSSANCDAMAHIAILKILVRF